MPSAKGYLRVSEKGSPGIFLSWKLAVRLVSRHHGMYLKVCLKGVFTLRALPLRVSS